jgi:transposase InsO family protein
VPSSRPCADSVASVAISPRPGTAAFFETRSRTRIEADGPDQVWSWDITKLKGPARGIYYQLYVMLDIFSRKVIHFEIWPTETGLLAKEFIQHALEANGGSAPRAIYADRGTSMTSNTVSGLPALLGIEQSHSRPRVSNDTPYSEPEPTGPVIDTQSVKTSTNVPLTSQGTDAAKKIVGRKRGILTDTIGLILAVTVTAASLSENAVGIRLLDQAKKTYPTIAKSWVDTGFKNAVVEHGANLGINVEVVNRNPNVRGFQVVKRRWVVERSLGWLMLHRRLSRDYETLPTKASSPNSTTTWPDWPA